MLLTREQLGLKIALALRMHIRLTYIEPFISTKPADPEILEGFALQKAREQLKQQAIVQERKQADETLQRLVEQEKALNPDDDRSVEEIVADIMRKRTSIFHRAVRSELSPAAAKLVPQRFGPEDMVPIIWDYQWKGFMKDACGGLRFADTDLYVSRDLGNYKSKIDGLFFVFPRIIPCILPGEQKDVIMITRPLRTDTAQGRRVTIVRSEAVPAGTQMEIEVAMLSRSFRPLLTEWLDYGQLKGTGQWCNSGAGRFTWELLDEVSEDKRSRETVLPKLAAKPKKAKVVKGDETTGETGEELPADLAE